MLRVPLDKSEGHPIVNCKVLGGGTGGFGAFDFEEFSGADIVEEAVDRNGFGDERMVADAGDVVEDGLLLIADGEPLDVFTGAGAGAFADVLEALRGERRGFEARGEQVAHDVVGEEFHAAIGVVDDEEFAGAEQFVADDEGTDGVVAGAAAGVADDVSVAFGEAGILGGIETRVHARENGETARGRQGELAFLTKIGTVILVGFKNFRKNLTHSSIPLFCGHESPRFGARDFGGARRNRTADNGFADHCLTTWRPRHRMKNVVSNQSAVSVKEMATKSPLD